MRDFGNKIKDMAMEKRNFKMDFNIKVSLKTIKWMEKEKLNIQMEFIRVNG